MAWLWLLGTSVLYDIFASSTLVRILPAELIPCLPLIWVYVLADRTASTPARENAVWLSGAAASVVLGYLHGMFLGAPRGLHSAVFALMFIGLRFTTNKLTQASFPRLALTLAAATLAATLGEWWLKGLITGFTTLSIAPVTFAVAALSTGAIGAALFRLCARVFDERGDTSFRRLG